MRLGRRIPGREQTLPPYSAGGEQQPRSHHPRGQSLRHPRRAGSLPRAWLPLASQGSFPQCGINLCGSSPREKHVGRRCIFTCSSARSSPLGILSSISRYNLPADYRWITDNHNIPNSILVLGSYRIKQSFFFLWCCSNLHS